LAEAVLTVGLYHGALQSRAHHTPRPILALNFYGMTIVLGITVANNGFIVGMNAQSWKDYKKHCGKAFSGNWTFREDESEDECDDMDIEDTPQMEFYPFTSAEPFTATGFPS